MAGKCASSFIIQDIQKWPLIFMLIGSTRLVLLSLILESNMGDKVVLSDVLEAANLTSVYSNLTAKSIIKQSV
jgi:hypothetical protein